MSTADNSLDTEQLNQVINTLTKALTLSERRHAHLLSTVRWLVLGTIAAIIFLGLIFSNTIGIGIAHANKAQGIPQGSTVVEALNNINNNLVLFGAAAHGMQQAVPVIEDAVMNNEDVQKYVVQYLTDKQIEPTPENLKLHAPSALAESVVTTVVDSIVLMQRIREDSNVFRDAIGAPGPVLEAIQNELKLLNTALRSVPAMAMQMDLMNRNMAIMSRSMGSTMGKMGNWMPW